MYSYNFTAASLQRASCVTPYVYSLRTHNLNHHEDRIRSINYCTEEQELIFV